MSLKVDEAKSEAFRIQGNTSFKKGKWTEAIGHYTSATIHNPQDPVSYCNRAFAYLKLDKYNDAERDCTTALKIQHNNIKALYRRGLARRGLERYEEALTDIDEVLSLDRSNGLAIEEKEELEGLIEAKRAEQRKQESKPKLPPSPPKSARIEELPPDDPVVDTEIRSEDDKASPITPVHASSFTSLRETRDKRKTYTSTTQRRSVNSTTNAAPPAVEMKMNDTQRQPDLPTSTTTKPPVTQAVDSSTIPPEVSRIPPPPLNPSSTAPGSGLQLLQHLINLPYPSAWIVLTHYPTEIIPAILSPILEPDSLGRLLEVLHVGAAQDSERVRGIMSGLKGKGRWGLNIMLLSEKEKKHGDLAWSLCGGQGDWR